ncbi:MAG: outer membrane lipoprotein chaperone LolA [Steroidobacteraceae bacterium]
MARYRLAAAALVSWMAVMSAALAASSPAIQVEKYMAGLKAWSADFEQTIDDGHGKVLRSASGKFYLQRPGRFRWDYEQPSEQLILADGKEIWFYDKDLAQANVRDMDSTLASTPAMLLSGGSVGGEFDITELPESGGLRWFQLIPKHPETDFQLVRIGFDGHGELASMFLADKLNQITQLKFTHPIRNPEFAPGLFSFSPPPGVDVIGRAP